MKKVITHGLPLLFLICFVAILINAVLARPRVLVIMSYTIDNEWEQQIRKGIETTFNTKAPHYLVNYFYLHTLNNSKKDIQRNVDAAKAMIDTWKPQVLITSDDDAQTLIGTTYLNKPNISIVFNGVNANPAIYGYIAKENVTGIIENLHYDSTRQALQLMFPNYHQIIHLSDNSNTSAYVYKQVLDFNWQPLQIINSVKTNSLAAWLATVQQANDKNALLLLTHFDSIYDQGRLVPPKEVMELTLKQAHVPIFDFFDFTVTNGVPMALSTSGLDQGATAAELAMRIIDRNEKAGDIPFAHSTYFNFAINHHSIDINMPQVVIPEVYRSLAYLNDSTRL
jgi:ABC-type uncharacterized transport system substrate-binding protein